MRTPPPPSPPARARSSGSPASTAPAPAKVPKQRQSKACKRCLRRKQRCHGFPVCRACEEAKQPCEQSAYALQLHSNDSSSFAAFQRIQSLESQLASATEELAMYRQTQAQQSQHQHPPYPQHPHPHLREGYMIDSRPTPSSASMASLSSMPPEHHDGRLAMPLLFSSEGLHSPFPGSGGAPDDYGSLAAADHSHGPGAGGGAAPRASAVEQMVTDTVWAKGMLSVVDGLSSGLSSALSPPSPLSLAGHQVPGGHAVRSASPPEEAMGQRMLDTYFCRIHPRYPFLDRDEIFRLHAQRRQPVPPTLAHRFNAFKLNMVYAIGGTLVKLTDPLSEAQAEGYFAAARRDVSVVQEAHTLQTIEGLVLLVLYNLRAPTNTGIWYMTNLAMQTCIDLGLHLESTYHAEGSGGGGPLAPHNIKMRRLFWSVYTLDRFIALSFKRPFSIPEHDIETRILPSAGGDPAGAGTQQTHQSRHGDQSGPPEALAYHGTPLAAVGVEAMWPWFIEIKRLESRIQTALYGPSEPLERRRAHIEPLLADLDAWHRSLPRLAEAETIYLQLHFNGAIGQVLRPFLSTMRSSHGDDHHDDTPNIARCLHASGNVTSFFKRMHQRDGYGHSFVSAHLAFIAGVTMCYCLFLAPQLFDHHVANQLRACSSNMFVIASNHRLRKHRDILEDIIGRIIDARMNVSMIRGAGAPGIAPSGGGSSGSLSAAARARRQSHGSTSKGRSPVNSGTGPGQTMMLRQGDRRDGHADGWGQGGEGGDNDNDNDADEDEDDEDDEDDEEDDDRRNNNSGTNDPNAGDTTRPVGLKGRRNLSQLDFVAVQSLVNLAAQQEPDTSAPPMETMDPTGATGAAAAAAAAAAVDSSNIGMAVGMAVDHHGSQMHGAGAVPTTVPTAFAPPTTATPGGLLVNSDFSVDLCLPGQTLDFNVTGSWDVDRYSLEMLGRMIAPE